MNQPMAIRPGAFIASDLVACLRDDTGPWIFNDDWGHGVDVSRHTLIRKRQWGELAWV